jgi:hypothetical protein
LFTAASQLFSMVLAICWLPASVCGIFVAARVEQVEDVGLDAVGEPVEADDLVDVGVAAPSCR